MVYLISKSKLPNLEYVPIESDTDIPLMGMTKSGPVIFFTTKDEIVFITWKEIASYALTAPRQKTDEQEEKKADPKKPREVR